MAVLAQGEWFSYPLDEKTSVSVVRKRIKTLRLRINLHGSVSCSVPWLTTKNAVITFIESRRKWIEKSLAQVKSIEEKPQSLRPDSGAALEGLTLADFSAKGYSKAWKYAALKNFSATALRFLPCFLEKPIPFTCGQLKGRAMKSLWGSCNRRTNIVTLNWALFAAPQACIDYVVLHELTHFLYLYHDKQFYGFIARWMPDYKERIKILKTIRME